MVTLTSLETLGSNFDAHNLEFEDLTMDITLLAHNYILVVLQPQIFSDMRTLMMVYFLQISSKQKDLILVYPICSSRESLPEGVVVFYD